MQEFLNTQNNSRYLNYFFFFNLEHKLPVLIDQQEQEMGKKETDSGFCAMPDLMCQSNQERNDSAAEHHVFEFEGKFRSYFAITSFVYLSLNGRCFILCLFTKIIVCERK
jgi:hypothetical protein